MDYIYRALRADEFYSRSIISKELLNSHCYIDCLRYDSNFVNDGLNRICSHITTYSSTPWISCTRDRDRVKKYLYEKNDFIYGLAVIKNHSKEAIDSARLIQDLNAVLAKQITEEEMIKRFRRYNYMDIRKCVLDFSTGESNFYNSLINFQFLHFFDGRIRNYTTVFEQRFSSKNKQLLVFWDIPGSDAYILSALMLDLIDYLKSNYNIIEDDELYENLTNEIRINYYVKLLYDDAQPLEIINKNFYQIYESFTDLEKYIFDRLYLELASKKLFISENPGIPYVTFNEELTNIYEKIIDGIPYLKDKCREQKDKQRIIIPS